MSKVYRKTDRKKIDFGDISISISPMGMADKAEVSAIIPNSEENVMKRAFTLLSRCVKKVEGVTDQNNEPYSLEFDDNKHLTEECFEVLMTLPIQGELVVVCQTLFEGFGREEFSHPITGEELEGVSFAGKSKEGVEKKK